MDQSVSQFVEDLTHAHEELAEAHSNLNSLSITAINGDDSQLVWERIFQRTMERADVYQQSAFDTLCHVSRRLGAKERQDGAVGCLMTVHDSLIEERGRLIHLFDDTPRKRSTHELVEQANGFKAKVKMFYCNVQQALEDCDIAHSPSLEVSPLSHYKFPESLVEGSKAHEEASYELHAAQDSFAYSALGLYNLEPPSQRFGGSVSQIQDEPTELACGLLSQFDIDSDVPMSNGPFYDEPQELRGMSLNEPDQARWRSQTTGSSQPVDGVTSRSGSTPQSSLGASCTAAGIAPLKLRTFCLRTRDTLNDE